MRREAWEAAGREAAGRETAGREATGWKTAGRKTASREGAARCGDGLPLAPRLRLTGLPDASVCQYVAVTVEMYVF